MMFFSTCERDFLQEALRQKKVSRSALIRPKRKWRMVNRKVILTKLLLMTTWSEPIKSSRSLFSRQLSRCRRVMILSETNIYFLCCNTLSQLVILVSTLLLVDSFAKEAFSLIYQLSFHMVVLHWHVDNALILMYLFIFTRIFYCTCVMHMQFAN